MPLTYKQKIAVAVSAILVVTGVVLAIVLSKKKKKTSGGGSGGGNSPTQSSRVFRPAIRVPFDSYPEHTTVSSMPTMATAMQARIQNQLGPGQTVTVTPAGLEELHWLATQRKKPGVHNGLHAVTVVPTPGSSCKTLAAGKDWSAIITPQFTLSVTEEASPYGAFIFESNTDSKTLNAAIEKASNAPTTSTKSTGPAPFVFIASGDDSLDAAPNNTEALKSCSITLPVTQS